MPTDPGNAGPTCCCCSSERSGQSCRPCHWWPRLYQMLLLCSLEAGASYSLGFFCPCGVLLFRCSFYFPDFQTIKDDDFVLFFSLTFHAAFQCYSRSPWAKDLLLCQQSLCFYSADHKIMFHCKFHTHTGDTRCVQKF